MNVKRRRTIGSVISLASMADIAFLLLVFFVVTSAIGKKHDHGIRPPRAESRRRLPKDLDFTLNLTHDGVLRYEGKIVTRIALQQIIRNRLKQGKTVAQVQVSADRGCTYGQLSPYLKILKKAGVKEVIFAAVFKKVSP